MSNSLIAVIFASLLFSACATRPPAPPPLDKDWTLNPTPNALDVVGTVFAVDEKGDYQTVPGGVLDLKVIHSPVALTERTKTKNVSIGLMVNFLGLEKKDSAAAISIDDSTRLNASFIIDHGELTRIDDDILAAFGKKKQLIEANIDVLNLQRSKLFIILETIQSNNVNIVLSKDKRRTAAASAKIKELAKLTGNAGVASSDNSSLVYNNPSPVTIFYKLNAINVYKTKEKDSGKTAYEVELGKPVTTDSLNFHR